jgi:hypothetical protein
MLRIERVGRPRRTLGRLDGRWIRFLSWRALLFSATVEAVAGADAAACEGGFDACSPDLLEAGLLMGEEEGWTCVVGDGSAGVDAAMLI